jgi:outer membrane autotransporter protein
MFTIGFGAVPRGQAAVESKKSASAARRIGRGMAAATGIALTASLFAASGAQAQNCALGTSPVVFNLAGIGSSPAAVGSMIAGSIAASSTAFLLQSSAFVGAPPNPAPDQQGGGIWVRGVGGEVSVKSSTATSVTGTTPTGTTNTSVNCTEKVKENFAGEQVGADIARLNLNGWNVHLGTTVGYLGSTGSMVGGAFQFADLGNAGLPAGGGSFTSSTTIPFAGVYAAATNGGFFADALLRAEYYQSTLTAPGDNLFGQPIDGHGWSFASSAGYNWQVPSSKWFVEPSASIIISQVKVDPLNMTTAGNNGPVIHDQIPGTLIFNTVHSDIGRLGLRVGQTIESGNIVWQPFAAVSVWHEFGPNYVGNYATSPACCVVPTGAFTGSGTGSISTVGTFGQYSLGISGAIAGTGWLGFARVDYRDGPNLEGLSGTGGIRYQFNPDMAVASRAMAVKAPVFKAPVAAPVNWTGFYVGGFAGATLGNADWGYGVGEVAPHIGGFLGGGNVGFDWQTDRWVLGAVAELGGTNTKGGTACNPNGTVTPGPPPGVATFGIMAMTTCNASASWIGDIAARVGYTWDRALFYAKAGGAWTDEHFTASCTNVSAGNSFTCTNAAGAATTGFTTTNDRTGWILGYGAQFALTRNWSAKAETDYVSFGDHNVVASDGSALKVGMHVWEEKVGLDYRFNTGP